jgi:hypothetical protein
VKWETTTAQLFRMSALYQLGAIGDLQVTVPALTQASDARGDLYTSVTLRIRQFSFARLAADDPQDARRIADEAMRMWNPAAYLSQHYYHLVAVVNADLYEGRGAGALERLKRGWRDVERSLFLRVQVIRIEAVHMRGRAALIAAQSNEPSAALIKQARADARRLEEENAGYAKALAKLLRAGIAARAAEHTAANAILGEAIAELEAVDMRLWANAARWVRGERGAVADWMRKENIRNPTKIAALLVPGFAPPIG